MSRAHARLSADLLARGRDHPRALSRRRARSAEACEQRAVAARAHAAAAGVAAFKTVPGAEPADWLDAGQCRDCEEPAFNYRPKSSAQYIAALGNFDAAGTAPRHFRFGFIASSDNHFARPGTGYKQKHRRGMTESQGGGPSGGLAAAFLGVEHEEPRLGIARVLDRRSRASTCSRSSARPRS